MLSSQIRSLNTPAPMVGRSDRLSAWLERYPSGADVLLFGAITGGPYDETDQVLFEGYGTVEYLGQSMAR